MCPSPAAGKSASTEIRLSNENTEDSVTYIALLST
jgi:hypothetical protein